MNLKFTANSEEFYKDEAELQELCSPFLCSPKPKNSFKEKRSRKLSFEDFFTPVGNSGRKWSLMEALNINPQLSDVLDDASLNYSFMGEDIQQLELSVASDEDKSVKEDSILFEEKLKKAFNVDDFGFSQEGSFNSLWEPSSNHCLSDLCTNETSMSGSKILSCLANTTDEKNREKLNDKSPSFALRQEDDYFVIKPDEVDKDVRRTLFIKNIPIRYARKAFVDRINKNFAGCYDYFYMPLDPHTHNNLGYAFINMKDAKYVKSFYNLFHGKKWKLFRSGKVCDIKYARIQGKCEFP